MAAILSPASYDRLGTDSSVVARMQAGIHPGIHLIPAQEYRRERWRNGLGWTREILRQPDHEDWDWRLSIAEIESNAAFSAFPGVERELVLLSGNGVRLQFDDAEVREVMPPHGRVRFAGESGVYGVLVDGPTHDFNLMWKRDRIDAQLWHRPLVGSMVVFVEPGEQWAMYVLSGQAHCSIDDHRLNANVADTMLLSAQNTRMRFNLQGGGEILLIRLRVMG